MIFTAWDFIYGLKFGGEVCEGTALGETFKIKIDLFMIRVTIRYYGEK